MSKYSLKDAAEETGESTSSASAHHHQAREDARDSGYIPKKDGSGGEKSGRFSKTDSSGKAAVGFFKKIFGG